MIILQPKLSVSQFPGVELIPIASLNSINMGERKLP